MTSFIDRIKQEDSSDTQKEIAIATVVKSIAEGPLYLMRNYLFQYLAISKNFEIEHVTFLYQDNLGDEHVDVGFEADGSAYIRMDSKYKDSGDKMAIDLTFIGIGRILTKDPKLEVHRARIEGVNWVNRFNATIFTDLRKADPEGTKQYAEYFARSAYFWLSHNDPDYLTATKDKEEFVEVVSEEFIAASDNDHLDMRLNDAIISGIMYKETKALEYFKIYVALITMPTVNGISMPSNRSADFMSLYLHQCMK